MTIYWYLFRNMNGVIKYGITNFFSLRYTSYFGLYLNYMLLHRRHCGPRVIKDYIDFTVMPLFSISNLSHVIELFLGTFMVLIWYHHHQVIRHFHHGPTGIYPQVSLNCVGLVFPQPLNTL